MRNKLIVSAIVCAVIVATAGIIATRPHNEILVTISPGMTAEQIAHLLKNNGVIASESWFTFWVKLHHGTSRLKAGDYLISNRMPIISVVRTIIDGKSRPVKVTIPEGWTAEQIAKRLETLNLVPTSEFLEIVRQEKLEGFLFPETYYFPRGVDARTVIDTMLRQLIKTITPEMLIEARKHKLDINDIVTLASMIEKEARTDDERYAISGVFYNRLKKRWYLESCATVRFALNKATEPLVYGDLDVDSLYNTYRHYGLPPGPICNPGLASIRAAVYPAKTDSMFFVAQGDGTHSFSRYYEEHLKTKQKTRRKHAE